ncbi:hypothetical protein [Parachlamydia sp. AcF125]|uniref:hypothetical protein n=1 Tax=Parachlamydia sp. AcF125 TaxID=2795736 RepID=UPI001BC92951|nr:hypothetical protein [Parachlamydia sp. AcF125]MBS4169090.1 hypothetical protein [Parachlamydia sp. AcF125]
MITSTEPHFATFDLSLLGFSLGNLLLCKVRELNQEDDRMLHVIGCIASMALWGVGLAYRDAPAFQSVKWMFKPLGLLAFMSACIVNVVGLKAIFQQPLVALKAAAFSAAWCGMKRLYDKCYIVAKKPLTKNLGSVEGSSNQPLSGRISKDLAITTSSILPLALTGQIILQSTPTLMRVTTTTVAMLALMEFSRNWVHFKASRTYTWVTIKVAIPLLACAGLIACTITHI